MDINSFEDLQAAEEQIGRVLKRIRLDSALLGLRKIVDQRFSDATHRSGWNPL